MVKDIKLSDTVFDVLFKAIRKKESELGERLSYSEYIGTLLGMSLEDIRKQHKHNRYVNHKKEGAK